MSKDEVISLRSVLTELFLELGRRFSLDVANRCVQAVLDAQPYSKRRLTPTSPFHSPMKTSLRDSSVVGFGS